MTTVDHPSRFYPRAAVWGGALASTAMNLSANWHATTVDGVTQFIAPTSHGLHLPEAAKMAISGLFPLLLIFAVESAARTSLRWRAQDLGSYAMPVAALAVFAFSVGEVTRLLLGMGQPLALALLFALAPDLLITAGTVVLMRERKAEHSSDASGPDEKPDVPDVRESSGTEEDASGPVPDEKPDVLPQEPDDVRTSGGIRLVPPLPETASPDTPTPEQDVRAGEPDVPGLTDERIQRFAAEYRTACGTLPTPAAVKRELGGSWDRAKRVLDGMGDRTEETA